MAINNVLGVLETRAGGAGKMKNVPTEAKWEVLGVEPDGDPRSYAILTQNFSMKSGESARRREKPKKSRLLTPRKRRALQAQDR